MLIQILLDHECEQLRDEFRVSSLMRACGISTGKIGSPSGAAFRGWRGTGLVMGFQGTKRMVVSWHVVPNVRELVKGDADICYLQTNESNMTPNARIQALAFLLTKSSSSSSFDFADLKAASFRGGL